MDKPLRRSKLRGMVSTKPIPSTDAADTSSNTLTSQRENIATVGVEGGRKLSANYADYKARRESERAEQ
jgi:hypothetical protein